VYTISGTVAGQHPEYSALDELLKCPVARIPSAARYFSPDAEVVLAAISRRVVAVARALYTRAK
jgi:hypothetical protein